MKKKISLAMMLACVGAAALSGCSSEEGVGSFVERSQRCSGDIVQQFVGGAWTTLEKCEAPLKCKLLSVGAYGCVATQEQDPGEVPSVVVCKNYGESKCTSSRDALLKCSADGTSMTREACPAGEFCDEGLNKCISQSTVIEDIKDESCEEDEVTCVNNALARCVNGKWAVDQICGSDETCADGQLIQGCYCNLGAARCDNNILSVCKDYAWPDKSESLNCGDKYTCSEEEATCVLNSVCVPGTQACDSADTFHVCDENGQWGATTDCKKVYGENYKCAQAEGVCYESTSPDVDPNDPTGCTAGEKTCLGESTLGVCDGVTFTEKQCSDVGAGFVCHQGECVEPSVGPGPGTDVECDEGATVCDGNALMRCMNGVFSKTDCGDKTCTVENDKASCKTTTSSETGTACTGNGMKCAGDGYIRCVDGKWSGIQSCGNGMMCANDACITDGSATSCQVGSKRCVTGTIGATYQVCQSDGTWGTATSCRSINDICSGGECVRCEPGAVRCGTGRDRNYVYTCKADGSDYEKASNACNLGCNDGACRTCTGNEVECSEDGTFKYCSNGVWTDVAACGDLCTKSGCNCTVGATKCDASGNVLVCAEHKIGGGALGYGATTYKSWDVLSACGEGQCSEANGKAVCTCKTGDKRCADTALETCTDGTWISTDCAANNMTCDPTTLSCSCESGSYFCPGAAGGLASSARYRCVDGAWNQKDYACSNGSTCNNDLGGVCVKSQCEAINVENISQMLRVDPNLVGSKCEGSNLMSCDEGVYVVKAACQTGCQAVNTNLFGTKVEAAMCGTSSSSVCLRIGETRCGSNNASVETCSRQNWYDVVGNWKGTACAENEVCGTVNGKSSCVAKVCDAGAFSCDGSVVKQCVNNALVDVVDCATSGLTCKGGVCSK